MRSATETITAVAVAAQNNGVSGNRGSIPSDGRRMMTASAAAIVAYGKGLAASCHVIDESRDDPCASRVNGFLFR
jgi:hypothetical protein